MGDFNYTCALTHTAIREGDEVFCCEVVIPEPSAEIQQLMDRMNISSPEPKPASTYELLQSISDAIGLRPDNAIRWPSQVNARLDGEDSHIKTRSYIGEYDGYGSVKDHDCPKNQFFMVHCRALARVMEHESVLVKFSEATIEDMLYALVQFAFHTRVELFACYGVFLGSQYVDPDEITDQRLLVAMKTEILQAQTEYLSQYYEDESE